MRENIIKAIKENKIIVIVRGVQREKLIPLTEALYEGGIRLLEVTYSADGRVSDQSTAENIKMLCEHFREEMYIGAGTVLTQKQVSLTKDSGGKFIISPDTYKEVIEKTRELDLVSLPGAMTPSEIQQAHRFGADFVKLFPAANLGTGYIKAIKAPLSHIDLLAVGGINESNLSEYLKAGVCGVGVGANIVNREMLNNGDYGAIKRLAQIYVSAAGL